MPNVNISAYKNALKQAWKDGKMSADESAMLDTLRKSLNISADEHIQIESDVRNELSGIIPENVDITAPSEPALNNSGEMEQEQVEPGSGLTNNMPEPMNSTDESEGNNIKGLLSSGKSAYHKGNYEEAIQCCDNVLLLDPDNSEALFFRKRALSKIEKLRGTKDTGAEPASAEAAPMQEAQPEAAGVNNNAAPDTGGAKVEGGNGDPNCKSCGGNGLCHWCKGSGKCYWCKGTGNCDKCKGEGKIDGEDCQACKSSGKCHSCSGEGDCYWCKGSGKCSKCSM